MTTEGHRWSEICDHESGAAEPAVDHSGAGGATEIGPEIPIVHRTLIIAKIAPDAERQVASIFAESDQTSLPRIAGVRRRSLYRLDDLYVHLLETSDQGVAAVERARSHAEFARVSERLRPYITPYLATWQSPRDAQAHCFYDWVPAAGTEDPA